MTRKIDRRKNKNDGLTAMQEAFVLAMPGCNFVGAAAAREAGYSVKSAARMAKHLMDIPRIRQRVEALKAKNLKRIELSGQYLLDRLVDEIEADFAELFDDNGKMKKPKDMPMIFRKGLISGLEISKSGQVTIKLSDRIRRIELLGKHLQLFNDTVNLNHSFDPRGYTDEELHALIDGRR